MATVEELEARLLQLEARLLAEPRAAAPIVIGELNDVPAPGSPIASQWTQEVTRRTVHRFATVAARDAAYPAAAAGAGALAFTADTGTLWEVISGPPLAWWAYAFGARSGGGWTRGANVACANATPTTIPFDTEGADNGNWSPPMPSTTFTVPAGAAGVYAISLTYTFGAAITRAYGWITASGRIYRNPTDNETGYGSALAVLPLAVGDTVQAALFQLSGASRNATAAIDISRISA